MTPALAPATDADRAFCEALNRANMAHYDAARGIAWDPARFARSWDAFENHLILDAGVPVGLLRLLDVATALEIRDLQVAAAHQGRGIGSWAVGQAVALAVDRGRGELRLRVFGDNPARHLYARLGFRADATADGVVHMALDLHALHATEPVRLDAR